MRDILTLTMNPAVDISTDVGRIVPTHKLRCGPGRQDPGGGGINCARVISRLGGPATAVYTVGGSTGRILKDLVETEGFAGIALDTREETRLSFTVHENETDNEFRFVLPGPRLQPGEWEACLASLAAPAERADYLIVSGSMPPDMPEDFMARLARLAAERGIRIVLDSSGAALAAGLAARVYLAKPNLRELRELTGAELPDEASWLQACRNLVDKGRAEMIALTLGHLGAMLVTGTLALRSPALPIRPVSSVGAGDSFLGAMTWALARGEGVETALRYGVAAGSAALITPGTGLCCPEDVERLFPQTVVAPL